MDSLGVLTGSVKKIVERNARELSFVDGSLKGIIGTPDIRSLLITSCSAKEGKTVSVISMAVALSQKAGVKVVLVETSSATSVPQKMFGTDARLGLSDIIFADVEIDKAIHPTEYDNFSVIPFGREFKEKKLNLFETNKFKDLILRLKEQFDYVLVDGPAVFISPAITLIARHFDAVLFVVECEKTRWEVLEEATKKLKNVGGNVIGVVMNKRKYYVPRWFYG
jgi:protein-tyrosine kinase